ncbi:hypothetical protein J7J18_03645 [bacterium]|nr:hypothetical protein [bacterium]
MIEEFLKREGAVTVANSVSALYAIEGEKVAFVLCGLRERDTTYNLVIFESGCSFALACNGSFWINNKNETKRILERRESILKMYADDYYKVRAVLRNLYGE